MSLGIVVKAPEGLVLAAESRVTLQVGVAGLPGPITNHLDNATKIFDLKGINDYVGVVTYGMAVIGQRPAHSFVPELESELTEKGFSKKRRTILEVASAISDFYMNQWKQTMPPQYAGPSMTFLVGGFNEKEPYGRVYLIDIPAKPQPVEQQSGEEFGMTWGGQIEIVHRLLHGYDMRLNALLDQADMPEQTRTTLKGHLQQFQLAVPFNVLALQDCVNLAMFFIRSTIETQELTLGVRGCGGAIDVATITGRRGLEYVQRKAIHGERSFEQPVGGPRRRGDL